MDAKTTPRKPGRPAGTPKTGGKPVTSKTFICPNCKTELTLPASDVKNDHPCCSPKCAAAVRNAGKTITLPCSHCGKDVTKPISKVSKTGVLYCDKACWAARGGR